MGCGLSPTNISYNIIESISSHDLDAIDLKKLGKSYPQSVKTREIQAF
jgi:hypothetical protein